MQPHPYNGPPDPNSRRREAVEEEFVELITRSQTPLLAFLLSIIPRHADAEDVLQRTNVVLWRKREQFEMGTNFKAWAFATARWEALAYTKESKRKGWLVFNDELVELIGERLASVPDAEIKMYSVELRNCLNGLSSKHRRLILDRYQAGQSLKDCAKRFGRSEVGLRVTLHRLRITLRRCINKHLQTEPE